MSLLDASILLVTFKIIIMINQPISLRHFLGLLLLSLLSISATTYAEMYQWHDENGKLHFSDKKPIHLEAKIKDVKVENTGVSFADEKAIANYKRRTKSERKRELAQRDKKQQQRAKSKKAQHQSSSPKKMTYNDRNTKKKYTQEEVSAGLKAARMATQRRQDEAFYNRARRGY